MTFVKKILPGFASTLLLASTPAHAGIIWSTFIGGSNEDRVTAVTVHPSGDLLITGVTFSSYFPTKAGAFDTTLAPGAPACCSSYGSATFPISLTTQDVFVTRLSADGKTIVFSTLIGGTRSELPNDIVLDLIPVVGSSGGNSGGSSSSSSSVGSGGGGGSATGGNGSSSKTGADEGKHSIPNPGDGNDPPPPPEERIIIGGVTSSMDFPLTSNAVDSRFATEHRDPIHGPYYDATRSWENPEGFISVFDGTLGTLVYSTYLGTDAEDSVQALAVAPNHDIIAVGQYNLLGDQPHSDDPITATDFVVNGPYASMSMGFIARLSPAGQLNYGSIVGGSVNDVAMIGDDAVMVGGSLGAYFLPAKGVFGQTGPGRAFVMRVTPSSTVLPQDRLKFSSHFGHGTDEALSVIVTKDEKQDLIIAGNTFASNTINPMSQVITGGAFDTSYNALFAQGYSAIPSGFINAPTKLYDHDHYVEASPSLRDGFWLKNDSEIGDMFVIKMKSDGLSTNPILYGTYLGGIITNHDNTVGAEAVLPGRGLAIDEQGRVIIGGYTNSYNFPATPGAIDATPIKDIAVPYLYTRAMPFVAVLDMKKQGQKDLVYSTFLGNQYGYVADVDVVAGGNIIAVGRTNDSAFPTTLNSFKPTKTDLTDGFITVLDTKLLPSGKYGMYTDNVTNADDAVFGTYTVNLDIGDTQPYIGNQNFKLKLTGACGLEGKSVTLYISPLPLLPGQPSALGGTYTFLDLTSKPNKVLKVDGTINTTCNESFKIPLTPGATTVGTKGVPFYAQAFITKNAGNNKYVATNAIMVTPQ